MAQSRRTLASGLASLLVVPAVAHAGSVGPDPDAALLALGAELSAAVAEVSLSELHPEWSDDEINRVGERLRAACWAIINASRPHTPAGWALKAAASMHEFKFAHGPEGWEGDGETMAWSVLSELAGDAYVPWTGTNGQPATCEPPRKN